MTIYIYVCARVSYSLCLNQHKKKETNNSFREYYNGSTDRGEQFTLSKHRRCAT